MIVVSGTPRSGTSLWMQLLHAGGLPVIGDAFPAAWGEALRDANPAGFFESDFREGVYFATNPHPITGDYLFAEETRAHAVKIFINGLVRTELGFIDRCIVTVRHWREFVGSIERLRCIERRAASQHGGRGADVERVDLPPALEWWLAHFHMIRDCTARRYPVHFVTYDALLADPDAVVTEVFEWLSVGSSRPAIGCVRPSLRTQSSGSAAPSSVEGIDDPLATTMDELFRILHAGEPLTRAFVEHLNDQQRRLMPELGRRRAEQLDRRRSTAHVLPNVVQ